MEEMTEEEIEKKEIFNHYRAVLRASKEELDKEDKTFIRKAFDLALDAHKDMRRKSGEPYIFHPIAVAHIVAKEIGLGATSIAAALIHDVVEDSSYTLEDIDRLFGEKVARIIDGLTKISGVFDQNVSLQAENFRKMILTLSDDVRVILIKLADRLHNMRTMDAMPAYKQRKIASETLFLYAPLAHRLGLYAIKTELEDLSLKYTEPEVFRDISLKLNEARVGELKQLKRFSARIRESLKKDSLDFTIKERTKSIYSIRKKMVNQGVSFEEIYDKFAIRIIFDVPEEQEKAECWRIYSIVTDHYKPNPDRLRDWISTPKSNGYESLHTTVMGPEGQWVEVQIRSRRMDEVAEKGYAAHWKYKQDTNSGHSNLEVWINKIRELLENPESNAIDFIDDFKLNLFSEEIFVFTPAGDIVKLPKGATSLDFAFEIHSQVGARCLGGKVNGRLMPLNHKLKSGDQVEILTSEKQKPKEDWLTYVVTAKARSKIKNSLKEERKQIAMNGKEILERKLKHIKIPLNDKTISELANFLGLKTSQDVFYEVGAGLLDNSRLKEYAKERSGGIYSFLKNRFTRRSTPEGEPQNKTPKGQNILVFGDNEERLDYKFSKCCNPIPGDNVFGFTTVNEGIKVHRTDCPNAIALQSNYAYRILKAKWIHSGQRDFVAILMIKGIDTMGLVNNVTQIISNDLHINMRSINISGDGGIFEGNIVVMVHDKQHLNSIIDKIKKVEGITSVERIYKT